MVFLIHLNWQYLMPSSHSHPPILSRGHRRKTEVAAEAAADVGHPSGRGDNLGAIRKPHKWDIPVA